MLKVRCQNCGLLIDEADLKCFTCGHAVNGAGSLNPIPIAKVIPRTSQSTGQVKPPTLAKKIRKLQIGLASGIAIVVVILIAVFATSEGKRTNSSPTEVTVQSTEPVGKTTPPTTAVTRTTAVTQTSDPVSSQLEERSVVQVRVFENGIECWDASGVVFPTAEFIITNDHVVSADEDCAPDAFEIWLTTNRSQSVKKVYDAEVINSDYGSDLGILRITNLGSNVEDLVPLEEAPLPVIGDEILVYGFPGIAGDSLTVSKGIVSGFITQSGSSWIKTDASISGGSSGGPAVTRDRQLIGIVSQAGSSTDGEVVDCRLVEDTNNDGYIDDNDTCVPIGSSFSLLVPLERIQYLISQTPEIK
jgi:S1-C subfamily serine protease